VKTTAKKNVVPVRKVPPIGGKNNFGEKGSEKGGELLAADHTIRVWGGIVLGTLFIPWGGGEKFQKEGKTSTGATRGWGKGGPGVLRRGTFQPQRSLILKPQGTENTCKRKLQKMRLGKLLCGKKDNSGNVP